MLKEITEEDWPILDALAKRDRHVLWAPTHVILGEKGIVGSVSIGGVPFINVFYAQGIKAREVLSANEHGRQIAKDAGWEDFVITLGPESPMFRHMSKFGLVHIGNACLCAGKL